MKRNEAPLDRKGAYIYELPALKSSGCSKRAGNGG